MMYREEYFGGKLSVIFPFHHVAALFAFNDLLGCAVINEYV